MCDMSAPCHPSRKTTNPLMHIPKRLFSSALTLGFLSAMQLQAAAEVTFNKDIAPIIYKNCSECHRPGEAAPFTLLSYEDVRKKGKTIGKVTTAHAMPPWKAEKASYAYRDERRLKPEDIQLIQEWVAQGMPEGKETDKVQPPKFESGWTLGQPDLVVEMPSAYHLPADGPDIYRNIAVPLGLTEDKWITAIDMKPSARAIVHHVLYFADSSGRAHEKQQQGSEPGFSGMRAGGATIQLGGWAVGAQPHFFPEGLALNLPKGSDLVVQYHFHPSGKPEAEKSLIGLYFAKTPPERKLTRIQMPPHYSLFSGLDIPAGEKDFVIRDSYLLPASVDAVGIGAHAHYIAKEMKMTATLPSGEEKTLLSIKDWDFAWQDRYYFQQFVPLPQGTRLDVEIHWDNSAENPRNPSNPPVRVKWGEESRDEMGSISLIAVAHEESDLKKLNADLAQKSRKVARDRLRTDPELAARVAKMLTE
jgi:mono/diheme cytochrome c family protein